MNDSITLSIDVANNSTYVDSIHTLHRFNETRKVFKGPNHTDSQEQLLVVTVSDPTVNGENPGRRKSTFKLTNDVTVANVSGSGDLREPIISSFNMSVPVGATPAEIMAERQRMVAILLDTAIVAPVTDVGSL